jgi:hypothetical protein
VERLLGQGWLQQVQGAEARGEPWLDRARKTIAAAATVAETDPASGCTRAQFGETFKPFRDLRLRRNELEYPVYPDESVEAGEANGAVDAARGIVSGAERMLSHLGMF